MGKRKASTTDASSPSKKGGSASATKQVGAGFYAVPVSFPSTSIQPSPLHYLYCRPHTAKDDQQQTQTQTQLPNGRTLFVVNLPVDTTESHLRELFRKAGPIHAVHFHQLRALSGDDEEQDEQDDDDEEEQDMEQINERTKGKKGKGKETTTASNSKPKAVAPKLVPLPPLDPRQAKGSTPFLPTASSAHIVFLDEVSLTRAVETLKSSSSSVRTWPDPFSRLAQATSTADDDHEQPKASRRVTALSAAAATTSIPPVGLAYFLEAYRSARPPHDAVKQYADTAIARFAYRKAHPRPRRNVGVKAAAIGPNGELLDEDGFTIVQRGSKYGRSAPGSVAVSTVRLGQESAAAPTTNKKTKSEDLVDFYRFQMREKKRESKSIRSRSQSRTSDPFN